MNMAKRLVLAAVIAWGCPVQQAVSATLSKPGACFSAQALERFAAAYAAAYRIRQLFGPKIEQATDPQQAETLMQEADAAVDQAIRNHGLDVPSFFMLEEAIFGFRGPDFGPNRDKYGLSPKEIQHIVELVQQKMAQDGP